jgi:hypothetical protein
VSQPNASTKDGPSSPVRKLTDPPSAEERSNIGIELMSEDSDADGDNDEIGALIQCVIEEMKLKSNVNKEVTSNVAK